MIKTSLIINSKNPNPEWLKQCLESAKDFDEIILYLDGEVIDKTEGNLRTIGDGKERIITEGYNFAFSLSTGTWTSYFCDDDFFIPENLKKLIEQVKAGFFESYDVVHYKVSLYHGGTWGGSEVSYEKLKYTNVIPFGSLIKREVVEKVEGLSNKVGAYSDWNLWLRLAKMGAKFKYFDECVYVFRQGHYSATNRQLDEIGGHCEAVRRVLANA